jgi:hypothetical protein
LVFPPEGGTGWRRGDRIGIRIRIRITITMAMGGGGLGAVGEGELVEEVFDLVDLEGAGGIDEGGAEFDEAGV